MSSHPMRDSLTSQRRPVGTPPPPPPSVSEEREDVCMTVMKDANRSSPRGSAEKNLSRKLVVAG